MKLFSKILLVVAAMSAVAMVSCKKDNETKTEEAEFQAPANAENAVTVAISDQTVVVENKQVKEIEFTEGGYAIITYAVTKADDNVEKQVATYTYANGVYTITGFGTVKIEGNKVSVTAGGTTVTATATVTSTPATSGSTQFNLCRAWVLNDLKVSVSGGDLAAGVGKLFTYPVTMAKIDAWLKEQKVSVPEDIKITDYDIVDINFTNEGTFLVNFSKADPFVGDFKLTGTNFHYELESVGNYIINGEADGSVSFYKEKGVDYCECAIRGKIENNNKTYKSEITFTLKEK